MDSNERKAVRAAMVPKHVVNADGERLTQPEFVLGREGVQQLAKSIGCDPSDIVHVKRSRPSPSPDVNSLLD